MKSKQQNVDLQLADEKLAQAFYSNGRCNAVFLATVFVVIFAILLTAFWEGIVPIANIVVMSTPAVAIFTGLPRKYYLPGSEILIQFQNSQEN